MGVVYATVTDVQDAAGAVDLPPSTVDLIAVASRLVRRATVTAIYETDTTGLPTDTDVLTAMRDATCAHVVALIEAGITSPTGGLAGVPRAVAATAAASASIQYDGQDTASRAREARDLTRWLAPAAVDVLRDAGLTTGGVAWAGTLRPAW